MQIKDSGHRQEFETGAVRDMHEGKGDFVSMPAAALLRVSKLYEAGARKYGRFNYLKGIPVSSFIDSAVRHIFKYLAGWQDEDHLSAAAFNILGAIQMEETMPELNDIYTMIAKDNVENRALESAKTIMDNDIEEHIIKKCKNCRRYCINHDTGKGYCLLDGSEREENGTCYAWEAKK